MLRFAEFTQPETVRARTGSVGTPLKESKPVAHPCRGPGGQAGDYRKRNGPPTLWRPGNVVGPQRPIIMWHSPPAIRHTRLRVRRLGIGSAWHALHATIGMRYMLRNATFFGFFENFEYQASTQTIN